MQLPVEWLPTDGMVLEGSMTACSTNEFRPGGIGFVLALGAGRGIGIILDCGHPVWRRTVIARIFYGSTVTCVELDQTSLGCATVTGVDPSKVHNFRLLILENFFELYIDDFLVQSFVSAEFPLGNLALLARNSDCTFTNMKMWNVCRRA